MTTEQLAGLEEQRDILLKSLRDLEVERAAGDVADADYALLKDDYTARAATVLRAIETARRSPATRGGVRRPAARGGARRPPATARRPDGAGQATRSGGKAARPTDLEPPARRRRSTAVTLGVALAIAALAAGSVVFFASGRDPGEPVTGSVPAASADRVSDALALETQGRAVDALKLYDEVIRDDPGNVAALAYRGWLLKRAGLADKALESLDRAVAADPTFPDAHFFRGMVLYQDKDDPAGAVAEFQAFLANDPPPDFVADVQEVLALAEQAVAAKAAVQPSAEAPPVEAPPVEAPPAGP